MAVKTLTKTFLADTLQPATPATGASLEEIVNTFLKTLTPANVLDVQYSLAKTGKYGENYLFAAYVVYKGQDS